MTTSLVRNLIQYGAHAAAAVAGSGGRVRAPPPAGRTCRQLQTPELFGTKYCSDFRLDPDPHLTKADPKYYVFNPYPDNKVHSGATHRLMRPL
jgi:hypothetical protein